MTIPINIHYRVVRDGLLSIWRHPDLPSALRVAEEVSATDKTTAVWKVNGLTPLAIEAEWRNGVKVLRHCTVIDPAIINGKCRECGFKLD